MADLQDFVQGRAKIDPVIASALLDAGISKAEVARKLSVDPSTVTRFCQRYKYNQLVKSSLDAVHQDLRYMLLDNIDIAGGLQNRVLRYFYSQNDTDFDAIPHHQKLGILNSTTPAIGVQIDKLRLLDGQSTSNVDLHAEFESIQVLRQLRDKLTDNDL